jgi:hypothetical protein
VGAVGGPEHESRPAREPADRRSPEAPPSPDDALAVALERATLAGQWDVVRLLAKELEARRHAAAGNVVPIRREPRRS